MAGAAVNTPTDIQQLTPLMLASEKGHTGLDMVLLTKEAVVNLQDQDGWTALKIAAAYGHLHVVSALLDHGAVVDSADEEGWTPLYQQASTDTKR